MSALLIHGVPIECINRAAINYHVPAPVIISILQVEDGRTGTAHHNHNGTIDYGPMQINSLWLRRIHKYGFNRYQLQFDPCANVSVGTWILSQKIAGSQHLWHGIADYHSYSQRQNARYQQKVFTAYRHIMQTIGEPTAPLKKIHKPALNHTQQQWLDRIKAVSK